MKRSSKQFEGIKKRLYEMIVDNTYTMQDCIACIYDLYLEYEISEEQETKLYEIADPNELYNYVREYYDEFWEKFSENPLRI